MHSYLKRVPKYVINLEFSRNTEKLVGWFNYSCFQIENNILFLNAESPLPLMDPQSGDNLISNPLIVRPKPINPMAISGSEIEIETTDSSSGDDTDSDTTDMNEVSLSHFLDTGLPAPREILNKQLLKI